jgi:hypothetical protein
MEHMTLKVIKNSKILDKNIENTTKRIKLDGFTKVGGM